MADPRITDPEIRAYLEVALEEEHGLEIQTSDLDYLRRRIYRAIAVAREQGETRYDSITLSTSPIKRGCLWLVKEKQDE